MINQAARCGNFTSSEIVALTVMGEIPMTQEELDARPKTGTGSRTTTKPGGFGKKALTYIQETNMERRLGRSLDQESNARPLSWGRHIEKRVFGILPLDYTLTSTETDVHPEYPFWAGSKDGMKFDNEGDTVMDIKCPMTLKSFCLLVEALYNGHADPIQWIRENHTDGEKFYWQLVSNSCINKTRYAELIVYAPYESELAEIRMDADGNPDLYWLGFGDNSTLPYLVDGGYYKNVNIIRFEVPQADKDFLTARVVEASKMLVERKEAA